MAVTSNTKYNGKELTIHGIYSGTQDKTFKIEIASGTQFKWAVQVESNTMGNYTSNINLSENTAITLSDGVSIKFTQAANLYHTGDTWTFSAYADFTLGPVGTPVYTNMEMIDKGAKSDLVLISKGSGSVQIIEDIDGETPNIVGVSGEPLTPFTEYDCEPRNKELYVTTGNDKPPRWLGYSSNNGFEGAVDERFINEKVLGKFDSSEQPTSAVFDKFVSLRGGVKGSDDAIDTKNSRLLVGINVEEPDPSLIVFNVVDSKKYIFPTTNPPIAIRKWYKKVTHATKKYCAGVILMTPSEEEGCISSLQFWTINGADGEDSNMEKILHFKAPEGAVNNDTITQMFDFLCVPNNKTVDTCDYTLVFAARPQDRAYTASEAHNYEFLWKISSSEYDWEALGTGSVVPKDKYVNITPEVAPALGSNWNSNNSLVKNTWHYIVKNFYGNAADVEIDGSFPHQQQKAIPCGFLGDSTRQRIEKFPTYHALEFGGFDANGANPAIMFTVKLRSPNKKLLNFHSDANGNYNENHPPTLTVNNIKKVYSTTEIGQTGDMETSQGQGGEGTTRYPRTFEAFGPFYSDTHANENQRGYTCIVWATYAIDVLSTNSPSKNKIFAHYQDWQTSASYKDSLKNRLGCDLPSWVNTPDLDTVGTHNMQSPQIVPLVPATSPLFEMKGRFHITGYSGNTGKDSRFMLTYYKGGTAEIINCRWSNEIGAGGGPTYNGDSDIFPNRLESVYHTKNNRQEAGDPAEFGYKANISVRSPLAVVKSGINIQIHNLSDNSDLTSANQNLIDGANSDDKSRFRLAEGARSVTLTTDNWFPDANQKLYLNGVKNLSAMTERSFKITYKATGTDLNAVDLIASNDNFLTISYPSSSQPASSVLWLGEANVKKLFYKISFIYDGYQESQLLSAIGSWNSSSARVNQVNIDIKIKEDFAINKRINAIAVYRAHDEVQTSTEPRVLYRFLDEIPLYQFNKTSGNNTDWTFRFRDTGDAEATYEALNNISEKSSDLDIKYSVSSQQNGYYFVSNAVHPEIPDAEHYLFRSQPGKFSIIDWTKDFVVLPFIPLALKGFMGKIYAFGHSQLSVINPESLFIEDTIDGIGCLGPKNIKVTDNGMFWADYKNIYIAAPKIMPIGDTIKEVETFGWDKLSKSTKEDISIGYDAIRKTYLLFFTEGTSHRCWAFSALRGRWDLWDTTGKVHDVVELRTGEALLLQEGNKLVKYLAHKTNHRSWEWQSKKLTFGRDLQEKRIRNVKIAANSRSKTSLAYKIDSNYGSWNSGTDASAKFPGVGNRAMTLASSDSVKHYWIKYKIAGDNSVVGSDVECYAVSTIYKAKRYK